MSTLQIPLSVSTPRYDELVNLDGNDYLLDLAYNPRGEYWALTVKNAAGEIRAAGQKLAANAPMLRLFDDTELPPGEFWVLDTTGAGLDPTRDTLGSDAVLLYKEASNG